MPEAIAKATEELNEYSVFKNRLEAFGVTGLLNTVVGSVVCQSYGLTSTCQPTGSPSASPTSSPTAVPTGPTGIPTPASTPTLDPTARPTPAPTTRGVPLPAHKWAMDEYVTSFL